VSLVNNQLIATSRQLRHLRISFSIVYTLKKINLYVREYMTQIKMTNTITLSKHNSLNTQTYKHVNK